VTSIWDNQASSPAKRNQNVITFYNNIINLEIVNLKLMHKEMFIQKCKM